MYPRGHAGISLILSCPMILYIGENNLFISVLWCIIVMWSSIIPDIDISKRLFLSYFEHRGSTHTIWFGLFLSLFSYIFFSVIVEYLDFGEQYVLLFSSCALFGVTSHFIADVFNDTPIRPFKFGPYLCSFKLHYGGIKSDGYANNLFFSIGVVLLLCCILLVNSS